MIRQRLHSWQTKNLLIVGRLTLLQSVLGSILNYLMSIFKLSGSTCKKIDKISKRFWWGVDEKKTRYRAPIGCDKVCRPKIYGGLSNRRATDMNKSTIS